MAVSPLKYACAVKTAPLMNEDLTAASLKDVDAVRFADLTKQEMAATTPKGANAATCPLNCPLNCSLDAKFVALRPLARVNGKAEPETCVGGTVFRKFQIDGFSACVFCRNML